MSIEVNRLECEACNWAGTIKEVEVVPGEYGEEQYICPSCKEEIFL